MTRRPAVWVEAGVGTEGVRRRPYNSCSTPVSSVAAGLDSEVTPTRGEGLTPSGLSHKLLITIFGRQKGGRMATSLDDIPAITKPWPTERQQSVMTDGVGPLARLVVRCYDIRGKRVRLLRLSWPKTEANRRSHTQSPSVLQSTAPTRAKM